MMAINSKRDISYPQSLAVKRERQKCKQTDVKRAGALSIPNEMRRV
jgi:hypothetical protein